MNITTVPEIYVAGEGNTEIEVSSLSIESELYVRLNSYYVFTAVENEDFTTQYFCLATELAHIALGHRKIAWILLTLPARILPIYRHIYARAMNYSADKVAAVLVGQKEAIDSIIILSHDPYFITTVDKERYLKDIESFGTKWHYYARSNYHRNSDVPILAYRIAALSDSNGDGKLY